MLGLKKKTGDDFSKNKRHFLSKSGQLAFTALALNTLPSIGLAAVRNISFYRVHYKNWSGAIDKHLMLAAKPENSIEALEIANYAFANGYKMRAMGQMHNWSPITIGANAKSSDKIILVDTSRLNKLSMLEQEEEFGVVKTGSGVLSAALYSFLSAQRSGGSKTGYAFNNTPAPGDITVGGMMAIGGHGTGVSTYKNSKQNKNFDGSISNNILAFTAIVFSSESKSYVLKEFKREDYDSSAFLVCLGRAFITDFTLQVVPNYYLRCLSLVDISMDELSSHPNDNNQFSIANILDHFGRLEVILFPYTKYPWLKVWQTQDTHQAGSHITTKSDNFPFSDSLPEGISNMIRNHLYLFPKAIPGFGQTQLNIIKRNLAEGFGKENLIKLMNGEPAISQAVDKSHMADLWGPAWQTLVYIRKTTLRVTANGYAIHVPRARVQEVIHACTSEYLRASEEYREEGKFPVAGPLEIRITGLDNTDSLRVNKAVRTPALSALSPSKENSENTDTAIWLDLLTMPNSKNAHPFYTYFEKWLFERFPSSQNRVEWSKGWAYTADKGAWSDTDMIDNSIPAGFSKTQTTFEEASKTLRKYDPFDLFTAPLHSQLLK